MKTYILMMDRCYRHGSFWPGSLKGTSICPAVGLAREGNPPPGRCASRASLLCSSIVPRGCNGGHAYAPSGDGQCSGRRTMLMARAG